MCVQSAQCRSGEGTAATAIATDGRREGKASLFTAALALAAAFVRARVVRPRRQRPRRPLARSHFMTLITRFAEGGGTAPGARDIKKEKEAGQPASHSPSVVS